MCVFFVLPGERQKPPGSLQTAPVSPAREDALVQFAFSTVAARRHEEFLCEKVSDQYLLSALGRDSLQSNKVEVLTAAF